MCIGLAIYLYGLPLLPADDPALHSMSSSAQADDPVITDGKAITGWSASADHDKPTQPLERTEWRGVIALLVLFLPTTLFWATYEQISNTIILWADANTDRTVSLFGFTAQIPTTSFLAFNPFMIFAFTPLVVALWARQAQRGREPHTITKMALGCFGLAAAYLIMALGAFVTGGKASWLWLFGYFVVITLGELYISPVGLSLVTKVAPARILSMMMGVWLATSFVGGFLAGWLGSFWSRMGKPEFFLMIAAIGALAGLMIFVCRWALSGVVRE